MEGVDSDNLTPAMKQFVEIKTQHPDCILLFRMGDFYETFYKDAETVAEELQITLTARGKGASRAPLAGIPYHALDTYLPKLVTKGYKVAIVEQLEDPKKAKGLVKRGLVRIVTPGTVLESSILDQRSNNYIMSIYTEQNKFGIAVCDVSTGEFMTTEVSDHQKLQSEMVRFRPAELIIQKSMKGRDMITKNTNTFINYHDDHNFSFRNSYKALVTHFDTLSLEGYGIENRALAIAASGALLNYLQETQRTDLSQITTIKRYRTENYMVLDSSTVRNLELMQNIMDGSSRGSLLEVIDATITPMGARLLRTWLLRPLIDPEIINRRLNAVGFFKSHTAHKEQARRILKQIYDLERLVGRISYGSANARDLLSLRQSLEMIPRLKESLRDTTDPLIKKSLAFAELQPIVGLIARSIKEDAPAILRNGNIIQQGYNQELDELRKIAHGGKDWVIELEEKEKQKTGIKSMKVRFNKVFGYFIEISKSNLHLVPENYIRKQTTVNGERYITEELKEKESLILGAEEKILALEFDIFQSIIKEISKYIVDIQETAKNIAMIDCLSSLAKVAADNDYCKPDVNEKYDFDVKDGRHPVVEKVVTDQFVPNDCLLNENKRLHIITGPNMAGKSTFMRQVALTQLMAQIGSFVPSSSAKLGVVDRIFTRVGAYDDLSMGQSTFMVEMNETANILNNATQKSLIILDEIGRGTSTYDGVSIAWAVAEYIHEKIGAKCLFATHYHALNKLAGNFKSVSNFNIAVKEMKGDVIFLRKILEGGTDRSYGVEVAKLAGLPKDVVMRAREVMKHFEIEDEVSERLHRNLKRKHTSLERTRMPEQTDHSDSDLGRWVN